MRFALVWTALILGAFSWFVPCARADEPCPGTSQIMAEQAMRLHSELMVIGLTCGPYYREPADIYGEYRRFTFDNADLLRVSESVLQSSLGVRKFHELRTRIANDASRRAAMMSPQAYCRVNAPFVGDMLDLTPGQVRWYVSRLADGARARIPACSAGGSGAAVKKK